MGCDIASKTADVFITVSIHAPTWGATGSLLQQQLSGLFQSTHPHGVRLGICLVIDCEVSFNPRTHMGCDYIKEQTTWRDTEFQSTHPHGVRLYMQFICSRKEQFQSTHPHGVRHSMVFKILRLSLFQSTHPHGVRRINLVNKIVLMCFNPRTHMGCDHLRTA